MVQGGPMRDVLVLKLGGEVICSCCAFSDIPYVECQDHMHLKGAS